MNKIVADLPSTGKVLEFTGYGKYSRATELRRKKKARKKERKKEIDIRAFLKHKKISAVAFTRSG